ncbi:hypothetical protein N7535_001172 [Penicillium sp. DV-2018c]|nr:hypothetical protein N7461_005588 [Penicillium sp. DV-2018c]KAJ5582552.1 hypothetical protein N7535_001172 [Penicillium sp. DV-2018c]
MSHHSTPSFPSRTPRVNYLPKLRADLEKVAASRGNVHERKVALLVRWDNDTTGADQDVKTMGEILQRFGIQCTNLLLDPNDEDPSWTLVHKIHTMITECRASKVHSLFVFYYVGHGAIGDNGSLYLVEGGHGISWTTIRGHFVYGVHQEKQRAAMRLVDVLCVLDCCYSGAATIAGETAGNVAQVLAACGPKERINTRGQEVSFTTRLFRAVQHFEGQASVSTAALFQEVQRKRQEQPSLPNAVLETLVGTQPIRLAFDNHASSSRIPPPLVHVNKKDVLVKLTLHGRSHMPGHSDVFESFNKRSKIYHPI